VRNPGGNTVHTEPSEVAAIDRVKGAAFDYPELARITQGLGVEYLEDAEEQAERALDELIGTASHVVFNTLRGLLLQDDMLTRCATAVENLMQQGAQRGANVAWAAWVPDHLRLLVAIFDAAASPAESEATTDDGAPA
jgi:hypothetical protein